MASKGKAKLRQGLRVEYVINDAKGNYVGDFVPECAVCQGTYFEFGENYTTAYCVNCRNVVARRIDIYPEPEIKIKGRKVIGFAVDVLGDFKWVCAVCDNDLNFLTNDLATTICTECMEVTSRNKTAVTPESFKEKVTWDV